MRLMLDPALRPLLLSSKLLALRKDRFSGSVPWRLSTLRTSRRASSMGRIDAVGAGKNNNQLIHPLRNTYHSPHPFFNSIDVEDRLLLTPAKYRSESLDRREGVPASPRPKV